MTKKHKKVKKAKGNQRLRRDPARGGEKKAKSRAKSRAKPRAKSVLDAKKMVSLIVKHFAARGVRVILVGRACAAIYTGSKAKLFTIEFMVNDFVVDDVLAAMDELGFESKDERTFTSESSPYEIVLNPPPITVGDDVIEKINSVKLNGGMIDLLTPTDCVRHRLAFFYKWGDAEAMDDAVRVAKKQAVDMELIGRWSAWEWCGDKFLEFSKRV